MKTAKLTALSLTMVLALNGCASTPMGPTVRVLPPPNKSFDAFQVDQATCKDYARAQVAGEADSANNRAVGGALLGAALGAGLGAVAGGGRGAGVGAAAGGTLGTVVGAGNSSGAEHSIQRQYDNSYVECMAAKGNQVHGPVTVVQPVYAPPPHVIYAPPPTVVYTAPAPTVVYTAPPGAVAAPPPPSGYAAPPGAVAPPPNQPAPQ